MKKPAVLSLIAAIIILPTLLAVFLMTDKTSAPGSSVAIDENGAAAKTEGALPDDKKQQLSGEEPASTRKIDIEGFTFRPQKMTVKVGETVTWTNKDAAVHTVTAVQPSPEAPSSGDLAQDDTYSFTFKKAGTYEYYCKPHPNMRATVVVEE